MTAGATPVPARQFALFRILLGTFLALYFAQLLPRAAELFGTGGLRTAVGAHPAPFPLPNPLDWSHPAAPYAVLGGLLVLALVLAAGWLRAGCALALAYGWACLYDANPLISNPSLPYVGWLCLACALVPPGEGLVPGRGAPRAGWRMPRFLWGGAWVVMGLAYTLSGVDKLSSAAWREGSALGYIAGLPYAREGPLHDLFVALPEAFSTALTTSALAVELLFAPLALSRRLRPWIWLAAVGLHGGILLLMDFWELTMGVLLMHAFTFDARWLPASWRHLVMEEA